MELHLQFSISYFENLNNKIELKSWNIHGNNINIIIIKVMKIL